jgi:hypothetical protein
MLITAMPDAALGEAIGRDREDKPSQRRGEQREPELAQPSECCKTGENDGHEQKKVPGDNRAEQPIERPEGKAERPAGEHELRIDERLEAIWIAPRRAAVIELVPDQPEAVDGLQVVACRRLAKAGAAAGDERAPEVSDGGRGGDDRGGSVERRNERDGARQESKRAAASSSSTSGTSRGSYRHAWRIMPSRPRRNALRTGASRIPFMSVATPQARTASPFQSERSGKLRSRTSRQARCE